MIDLNPETLDLGNFVNALMRNPQSNALAAVTAVQNAKRQLASVLIPKPSAFLSLQYADALQLQDSIQTGSEERAVERTLIELRQYTENHCLEQSFDVVVADPYHSYQASIQCLRLCHLLSRSGGFLVVHDCLPPFDLMSPVYQPGQWCGVTFAAFREFCMHFTSSWFTIDADFGLGVMLVDHDAPINLVEQKTEWTLSEDSVADYAQRYKRDPFRMMRAIAPNRVREAMSRLMNKQSFDDLVMPFEGVGPRNPRPPGGSKGTDAN